VEASLEQAFASFAADPQADELSALLLVNRLLAPALDLAQVRIGLQRLERALPPAQPPWRFLREQGFQGNESDYGSLDNSRLDRLLATRRGIPISLAVLLIHVARLAGHHAEGVNFPGHFLVRVDAHLIDPFHMLETTERACLEGRAELVGQPGEALFQVAAPAAMLIRMLNNLKLAFAGSMAWHRALDVVDAQIILLPDEPGLRLERGDFWRRLGVVSAARDSYQEASRLTQGAQDLRLQEISKAVLARLRNLDGESDVVH